MFSESKKRAFGLISSQEDAKNAVQKLQDNGFSREQISIIGPNSCGYECQKDFNLSPSSDNALISGLAATDVGSVFATGAMANIVANNAVGFLNKGLMGALESLGLPENVAQFYSDGVANGDFLLVVDGTEKEIDEAGSSFDNIPIQSWKIYRQPSDALSR
ncbi:MAG: general stress protein [Cyanosarcina radialis HA8281-LM2]|jgi:hypothetical protein|nr:general stress protein [Cyanosarcina radialis HA8281-LM2]